MFRPQRTMQNKNFDLESVYQCQAFDKGFVVFGSYSVASYTHETQKGYLYLQVAQFFPIIYYTSGILKIMETMN